MIKLLQALAYQIGSQVSYNELSTTTGIDIKTIEKYITIWTHLYTALFAGYFLALMSVFYYATRVAARMRRD